MQQKRQLTGKKIAEARRLYLCGLGLNDIQKMTGTNASTVRPYLKDIIRPAHVHHKHPRGELENYRTITAEQRKEIVALYEQGLNKKQIAERTGRSPVTVSKYLKVVLDVPQRQKCRPSAESLNRVYRMKEIGISTKRIAETLHIGCERVKKLYEWMKKTKYLTLDMQKRIEQAYGYGDDCKYTANRLNLSVSVVEHEYMRIRQELTYEQAKHGEQLSLPFLFSNQTATAQA